MSNHLLETPKLGFGLMRLPVMKDDPDTIDYQQVCRMVDMFMEAGQTYYDTAYVYGKDGASEKAAKACLVDRYPRDSFTLATKLHHAFIHTPAWNAPGQDILISISCTRSSPTLYKNMMSTICGIMWRISKSRA